MSKLAALLLITVAAAFSPGTAFADSSAKLTTEQRKMQVYAKKQYERARMAYARGDKRTAKSHYVESIKTYEKYFGKNDARLVDPLAGYAQTFADLWQEPNKKQRKVLERVLELYTALDKGGGDRAPILTQLGDWWVTAEKGDKAAEYYAQAWQAIADDDGPQQANKKFQKAVTLFFKAPVSRPKQLGTGGSTTIVTYSIAASGRVENVRILESDARAEITSGLNKALRSRRYRPPVVDGVPIAVPDLKLSFTYGKDGGIPNEAMVAP